MKNLFKKISAALLAMLVLSACANDTPSAQTDTQLSESSNLSEEVESVVDNANVTSTTPALPSNPEATEVLIQKVINAPEPTETGTLNDLPQDLPQAVASPEYIQATTPESPQDCETIQDANLKALCYHAAGYSDNSPSTEEDQL